MYRYRYNVLLQSCVVICDALLWLVLRYVFFFQAEDGIRDLVRSRGLGDVYKRQAEIRRRLVEQVTGTVRWRESVEFMARNGITQVFELSLIHI